MRDCLPRRVPVRIAATDCDPLSKCGAPSSVASRETTSSAAECGDAETRAAGPLPLPVPGVSVLGDGGRSVREFGPTVAVDVEDRDGFRVAAFLRDDCPVLVGQGRGFGSSRTS